MQDTSRIFMVRPAAFAFNEQTALSNTFQHRPDQDTATADLALREFDAAVTALREAGIQVWVIEDTLRPVKPDAIFPNNWISTHADGTLVLYPMQTPNRRQERRQDIVVRLQQEYSVNRIIDLSSFEEQQRFLEGTGSIVFDHAGRIAYACISGRTDKDLLAELCTQLGYTAHTFRAVDQQGIAVYHTNVVMSIGPGYAIICPEALPDAAERQDILDAITGSGKTLIAISREQMTAFAGNALSVQSTSGESILVLSDTALRSLNAIQTETLQRHTRLLAVSIPVIEKVGGGGIRCMIAQNFLPLKAH